MATPGIPLVFTVHDLNYVHFSANTTALKRAYFAMIVKPACRRAARVLTVSQFSRQQIVEWAGISETAVLNVGNGSMPPFLRSASDTPRAFRMCFSSAARRLTKTCAGWPRRSRNQRLERT